MHKAPVSYACASNYTEEPFCPAECAFFLPRRSRNNGRHRIACLSWKKKKISMHTATALHREFVECYTSRIVAAGWLPTATKLNLHASPRRIYILALSRNYPKHSQAFRKREIVCVSSRRSYNKQNYVRLMKWLSRKAYECSWITKDRCTIITFHDEIWTKSRESKKLLIFPQYVETSLKLQREKFFLPRGYQPRPCYHLPIYQAKVMWPLSTHHFFLPCVRANCRNKMARKLGANIHRWLVNLFTASSEWGFPVVRCVNTRTTQTSL